MTGPVPLTPYQRSLFVFLSVATFFEGYDFIALAQVLPNLRAEMGLSPSQAGQLVGFINLGTVAAYFLVRMADRLGRRKVLSITIAGYTLFTFLSGVAPGVKSFAVFQMLGRIFLLAEWAISMVYAAEEFPAARRGMVMGVIQACSSLGSILCAAVVPLMLKAPWGWRTTYLVGILPLILLAFARRSIRETARFEANRQEAPTALPFMRIWHTPYRRRVLEVGLIWSLTYACTQNAVTFWKEFAMGERGLSDAEVAMSVTLAAVGAMPFMFMVGKLIDVLGRRRGAWVIFGVGALGIVAAYGATDRLWLTVGLGFGIFGATAVLPVLNAFTTELFPTHLRSDAWAWCNNVLGRLGYVLGPLGVGVLAETWGWGPAVQLSAVGPVLAVLLITARLPETKGRELEETAAVGH